MTTTGKNLNPVVVNRRRRQAVAMTKRGWTAREIGRELGLSMRTVERYKAIARDEEGR